MVIAVGSRLDAITTEDYSLLRDDQTLIQIHADPAVFGRGRRNMSSEPEV